MDILLIVVLSVLEAVGLFLAVRLWLRHRLRVLPRIFWSLFLLVPLFGLLMYGFILSDLDENPDNARSSPSDSDAFFGGGGHL
jgi:hypothetical protein